MVFDDYKLAPKVIFTGTIDHNRIKYKLPSERTAIDRGNDESFLGGKIGIKAFGPIGIWDRFDVLIGLKCNLSLLTLRKGKFSVGAGFLGGFKISFMDECSLIILACLHTKIITNNLLQIINKRKNEITSTGFEFSLILSSERIGIILCTNFGDEFPFMRSEDIAKRILSVISIGITFNAI